MLPAFHIAHPFIQPFTLACFCCLLYCLAGSEGKRGGGRGGGASGGVIGGGVKWVNMKSSMDMVLFVIHYGSML